MDRHADAVHRLLLSLGATPDDADDVLQDCFVSAWRGAGSFRGTGSARGWLFTIARNGLRRRHRRRAGEPTSHASLEALGADAGWGSEADWFQSFELRDELAWALAQLPPEEREVVVLRDLEGLSGEETASALGLSLAGMKSRLHRGRLHLMGALRQEDDDG